MVPLLSVSASDFSCPSPSGFYANPDDCASFYQCSGDVPYLYPCADGTYYDEIMVVCNWEDMVDCGSRPVDGEEGENDGGDDQGEDYGDDDGGDDGEDCEDDDGDDGGEDYGDNGSDDGEDYGDDNGGEDAENNGDGDGEGGSRAMPEKSMAVYLALTADSMENYTTSKDWQPLLYPYQQTSANVLMFTFVNPETMEVPKAFENLAATKGTGEAGSVPKDTIVLFSVGG